MNHDQDAKSFGFVDQVVAAAVSGIRWRCRKAHTERLIGFSRA